MRRSWLSFCAVVLAAASSVAPARASHISFVTGIEGQSAPHRLNRATCFERSKTFTFVWQVAISVPRLVPNYQIQVKSTSASSSTCTFGPSTSDECIELVGTQSWTPASPVKYTFSVAELFPEGCSGEGTRTVTLFVKDKDPILVGGTVEEASGGNVVLDYDFAPPAAPTASPIVEVGDSGLNVNWAAAAADAGETRQYRVYWALDPSKLPYGSVAAGTVDGGTADQDGGTAATDGGTSAWGDGGVSDTTIRADGGTGASSLCTGDYRTSCAYSGVQAQTSYRISGLANGERVYVAFANVDSFENEGPISPYNSNVPERIYDFFERDTAAGGQERGGFCFLATAAYGSSWHPLVGSLRRFRDDVLLRSEVGRDLVSFYYSWSPALAEVIEDTPWLRLFFRVTLAPVAAAAWFVVDTVWWQKLVLLALAWLVLRAARRAWRARRRLALLVLAPLALVAAVSLPGGEARAEVNGEPGNFLLELKVGAIWPSMDDRPAVRLAQPFTKTFGDTGRVNTGFELEWRFLKKYGTLGVSFGMMYWQAVGQGIIAATGARSPETTVLNVLPFQVSAVYRWDVAMRRYNVPLVPYAKFGADWYLWWVLNGAGAVSDFTDPGGGTRRGLGGTIGLHLSLGLQFQLDVIDRRMQRSLAEEIGVAHSYLFAEVVFSRVDDFNDRSFNFGSTYFMAGLAMEF